MHRYFIAAALVLLLALPALAQTSTEVTPTASAPVAGQSITDSNSTTNTRASKTEERRKARAEKVKARKEARAKRLEARKNRRQSNTTNQPNNMTMPANPIAVPN